MHMYIRTFTETGLNTYPGLVPDHEATCNYTYVCALPSLLVTPHRHTHLLKEPGGQAVPKLPVLQEEEPLEGHKVTGDLVLRQEVLHKGRVHQTTPARRYDNDNSRLRTTSIMACIYSCTVTI